MQSTSSNKKLTIKLLLATALMFGFGFALVPLYDIMCDALGINGKTSDVAAIQPTGMQADITRTIRVEFMAHVSPDMPCLLYTSPSPRDRQKSRMPSSA